MKTQWWAILLTVVTTLFTSTAQILYKAGVSKLHFSIVSIITNYQIIAGVALYAIGAGVLIIALKGGEVTVVYPIIATSYIWVSLFSSIIFGEVMNAYKWIGVWVIVAGITLIAYGSRRSGRKSGVAAL
jgi:drug/metabolite transporter (DMT)-like permease